MSNETILVTGGYGCIGAETTKWLIKNTDATVVICSRSVSEQRTRRVFDSIDLSRLHVVQADVTDQDKLSKLLRDFQVTRVVHLAAFQSPDCDAHRNLGLQINLAGTQNLIEAIKETSADLQRFIFASSIAVYGPRDHYSQQRVPMNVEPYPVNVYGTWKIAGEHISRLFQSETGVPTISIRPGVLFGPGRDAGLTSTPTTGMKCVALNRPYTVPFLSKCDYQFAPDVGEAFGIAAMNPFDGYGVFTLPGETANTRQMMDHLKRASEELGVSDQFAISVGDETVPFICDLEFQSFLEHFPAATRTPLYEAVKISLATFLEQAKRGWLTESDLAIS